MKSGLVVVKRYRAGGADAVSRGAMRRVPALKLEPSRVLLNYRGFDGQTWPEEFPEASVADGVAPLERLPTILNRLDELHSEELYDLLYVVPLVGQAIEPGPPGFKELGLDYGFYRGEYGTYSVVFHEIVFGLEPEMKALASRLNARFLLPDVDALNAVSATRRRLLAGGADLEHAEGEDPCSFLVFEYVGEL